MTAIAANSHTAEEFRAATQRAAVFPSDAGLLRLTGEDARDLLNRLSTNLVDPDGAAGEIAVTVLTSDRGRIVDLVYVVHCGDHQLMLTSPGQQQNVIDFLDKYTIMEDLEVEDATADTAMLTLTGPAANEILGRAQSIDAVRVSLPADPDDPDRPPTCQLLCLDRDAANRVLTALESAGAVSVSATTAETLRIAGGRPAYGSEMGDTYNPLEAGLIGAIDFHKGCYIGQEVIARLDTYDKVQKYLVTLRFESRAGDASEMAAALPNARLTDDAGDAMGLVTSAAAVPTTDGANLIGLGYVRTRAVQIGGRLKVASDDGDSGIVAEITAQPLLFGGEKPGLAG
ncbi:MAG: hypothetical protein OXI54_12115 [Chloroflexota bacterium]|nr:hypothetical protein [Chloroflexota bacterium]MDE2684877.1 hypothetical protein [Chloroflexota bacterium]